MEKQKNDEIRSAVRENYGKIAASGQQTGCGCSTPSCSGISKDTNLSPEKERVFSEAFRVLKTGGRLAIADVVATAELPDNLKKDMALHTACVAGASFIGELEKLLRGAGFQNIQIKPKPESRSFIREWFPGSVIEDYVVSATIEALKPFS